MTKPKDYKKLEVAYNKANTMCRFLGREPQEDYVGETAKDIYYQVESTIKEELGEDIGTLSLYPTNRDALMLFANAVSITLPYITKEETLESPIKLEELDNFPGVLRNRIVEANSCYTHRCYTACCVLCGSVLEAIINEKAPLEREKEYADIINQFYRTYELENEKKVLNDMKEWRHKSAHFSSMEFNENHAKMFINSLIMVAKKVYKD